MTRQEAIKKWGLADYAIAYRNPDNVDISPLVLKGLIDKHGVQVQSVWISADYPHAILTMKTTAKTENDF